MILNNHSFSLTFLYDFCSDMKIHNNLSHHLYIELEIRNKKQKDRKSLKHILSGLVIRHNLINMKVTIYKQYQLKTSKGRIVKQSRKVLHTNNL